MRVDQELLDESLYENASCLDFHYSWSNLDYNVYIYIYYSAYMMDGTMDVWCTSEG